MPHIKTDAERKDYRISVKVKRETGEFLEKLAAKMHKRGILKRADNKNAAIQKALDYAHAGQKEFGWDEVIEG